MKKKRIMDRRNVSVETLIFHASPTILARFCCHRIPMLPIFRDDPQATTTTTTTTATQAATPQDPPWPLCRSVSSFSLAQLTSALSSFARTQVFAGIPYRTNNNNTTTNCQRRNRLSQVSLLLLLCSFAQVYLFTT